MAQLEILGQVQKVGWLNLPLQEKQHTMTSLLW